MVQVAKRSGQTEEYDASKVELALIRAGASKEQAREITGEVTRQVYDGMSTSKIYGIAYGILEGQNTAVAAKYSLKQALMMLGPSGFPFEQFIARLLTQNGYSTRTNQVLNGQCVSQEVDIIAEKDGRTYMVECKYHNEPGIYTGLKEALYTQARYEDVVGGGHAFTAPWLICNTKISAEAEKYGTCKGMRLTSWGYPPGESIQEMIGKNRIYPITIIPKLSEHMKDALLKAGIILVSDLLRAPPQDVSRITGAPVNDVLRLIAKAKEINPA